MKTADTFRVKLEADTVALGRALNDVKGIYGAMMSKVAESLYHVGFQGNKVLFATAELVIGWLLLRQATVAVAKLEAGTEERAFYNGKVAVVGYWSKSVLPALTLTRKLVEQSSLELMSLADESF